MPGHRVPMVTVDPNSTATEMSILRLPVSIAVPACYIRMEPEMNLPTAEVSRRLPTQEHTIATAITSTAAATPM